MVSEPGREFRFLLIWPFYFPAFCLNVILWSFNPFSLVKSAMAPIKIDQNDPLYISASDSSSAVLVPTKLTGSKNYSLWSRSMLIAFLGKRKYGFVTRVCSKQIYRDELHEQWETCNAIILSWIMNTISKNLLTRTIYVTCA